MGGKIQFVGYCGDSLTPEIAMSENIPNTTHCHKNLFLGMYPRIKVGTCWEKSIVSYLNSICIEIELIIQDFMNTEIIINYIHKDQNYLWDGDIYTMTTGVHNYERRAFRINFIIYIIDR